MKNLRKILLIVLAVSMVVISFGGCAKKADKAKSGDEKTFTYWATMPSIIATQYQTMAEVTMYQELEKKTGIKIKFIHPPAGQEIEQFNLMMASKQLPDFIEYDWSKYSGGPDKAVNDNIIIKLNDIIETNSPNFSKQLTDNAIYSKQAKTDSGAYYGYPSLSVGKYRTFGGLMLRKDWLDELGLSIPETIEEWEVVLKQFKDKKGATAAFTSKNDLMSMDNSLHNFNSAFNVGKGIYVENGKIKFAPIEAGYKEWVATMAKWYKVGILDKDFFANNDASIEAKMTNGSAGACYGFVGGTMGKYMTAMKSKNPNYKLVSAQYPVKAKGEEPNFINLQNEVNTPFLAITTACKNPVEAAKWADFWYSNEGMMLKEFGVLGKTYNMTNGKPVYTDEILHNPQGLSIAEAMARNFRASSPGPGFDQNEDYLRQYYQFPEQIEAIDKWSKYSENSKKTLLPPVTPVANESQELTTLKAEINTYISEQVLKFVQGSDPMEKFDDFVGQLKKMNVDRFVELYQTALDRYTVR